MKLVIIVGGMSSEHDVSLMSGKSILEKINKEKYEIKVIYIKQNGNTYEYKGKYEELTEIKPQDLELKNNLMDAIKDADCIFPVLHGKYGEDGIIQGVFEIMKKSYVGCGILASAVCMDKDFTKKIVSLSGIPVAKSMKIEIGKEKYICEQDEYEKIEELCQKAKNELGYPMFIKPAREGSSFGVNKAKNEEELIEAIKEAGKYDSKILIEEEIKGRELECAVLGNQEIITSEIGEVKSAESFYSYDAKYNNPQSKTIIPAEIKPEEKQKIKEYAQKAFKAVDGKGLARVDFFLKDNGEIILNEINTLPGFTKISMYPKLFEACGIKYEELLDMLIKAAIEK